MVKFRAGRSHAKGYLAVPEGGDVPGVLVIHAWWGLNSFFKSVCDRLANAGFVVLAPDLYNGKTALTTSDAKHLRSKLKTSVVRKQLNGAVDYLRALFAVSGEKIGAVGFSLGGYWALWLSTERPREVAAVVPFYATRKGNYRKALAAFLGHFAEDDQWVPVDSVRKLEEQIRSADREAAFHIYPGTKHWFFEENRPDSYDGAAARLAWKRTVKFLHSQLQ